MMSMKSKHKSSSSLKGFFKEKATNTKRYKSIQKFLAQGFKYKYKLVMLINIKFMNKKKITVQIMMSLNGFGQNTI